MNEEKQQILEHLEAMRLWDDEAVLPSTDTAAYVDEILQKWAPLAERLGMEKEQSKLQDLAVKLGYPDDYKRLKRLLLESEMTCESVFHTFALPLRAMLDNLGIEYTLKYRMKSVYSIWRKMRVDNKEFDDVYDLFAARIVYKPQPPSVLPENTDAAAPDGLPSSLTGEAEVEAALQETLRTIDPEHLTCWRIYSVISMLYRIQTDRIKNWITHPKPSGYQALQMTVMGPDCNWIEIQVRSERMDYEAEHGSAAHWLYKQEKSVS